MFLSLLVKFGELFILSDLEESEQYNDQQDAHSAPSIKTRQGSPTEAFEGSEGFWQTSTVQTNDKNCFTVI